MSEPLRIWIRTEVDATQAVLDSTEYARAAGFDETGSRMIATVVSELARNILKYAVMGELRLRSVESAVGRGVEVEAVDKGPGIPKLDDAMQDHFSSGGTLGLGLPGVKRMMDEFSLESAPGEGTRVRAVKWI